MPRPKLSLRLFVAAPSDCEEERAAVPRVIERVNRFVGDSVNVILEHHSWNSLPPVGGDPQETINERLVGQCDVFVLVLNRRWGSPTANYSSGTEEEYSIALQRFKDSGAPSIHVFFREVPKDLMVDPGKDLDRVLQFKSRLIDSRECLFAHHKDGGDFKDKLEDCLADVIRRHKYQPESDETSYRGNKKSAEVLSAVTGPESSDVSTELLAAAAALNAQQPVLAETEARRALLISPHDSEAHRLLAFALSQQDRHEETVEHCLLALEESPVPEAVLTLMGTARGYMGDHEIAAEAFRKALDSSQEFPDREVARLNLAVATRLLGDSAAAMDALRTLVDEFPEYTVARDTLSKWLFTDKEYEDAREHTITAIQQLGGVYEQDAPAEDDPLKWLALSSSTLDDEASDLLTDCYARLGVLTFYLETPDRAIPYLLLAAHSGDTVMLWLNLVCASLVQQWQRFAEMGLQRALECRNRNEDPVAIDFFYAVFRCCFDEGVSSELYARVESSLVDDEYGALAHRQLTDIDSAIEGSEATEPTKSLLRAWVSYLQGDTTGKELVEALSAYRGCSQDAQ